MPLFSGRFPGPALFLLRFASRALLAAFHGWGRLNAAYGHFIKGSEWGFVGVVAQLGLPVPIFFAAAATCAEFFGGILLAIGLFTRYAALAIAVTMAVVLSYCIATDMSFELAGLYLVASLVFFLGTTTPLSLDGAIGARGGQL